MAAFDPYGISPDFAGQGSQAVTAWQQALAKLNFQKNNVMDKYGFTSVGNGDISGTAQYNTDGTAKSVNATGGLNGVNGISDFAAMDNKSGYGGFRDELNSESAALDAANNGPSRGFSGGLSNQAAAAAQQAVARSQQGFTQGYNQFASGFDQAGLESTNSTNSGLGTILQNQAEYGAQEAAWQSSIPAAAPTYTPGVSGGGSTPIGATGTGFKTNPVGVYNRAGSETSGGTWKGLSPAPKAAAPAARGGHAL